MILAVLQARMGSSRLPGKVMKPILGQPMLYRQIERVRRCTAFEKLVVATSTDPSDDPLAKACPDWGVDCVRGSVDDVLSRFALAIERYKPDAVVRLTGDCPLADPDVIGKVIAFYAQGSYDYVANVDPDTYPDGLDVEVARASSLLQAHREATHKVHREHVMPYLHRHPELFRIGRVTAEVDLSHLRWTVDEPADFEFVRTVYDRLYPANPAFTTADILELLAREPQLQTINAGIRRNAGLLRS